MSGTRLVAALLRNLDMYRRTGAAKKESTTRKGTIVKRNSFSQLLSIQKQVDTNEGITETRDVRLAVLPCFFALLCIACLMLPRGHDSFFVGGKPTTEGQNRAGHAKSKLQIRFIEYTLMKVV